MFLCLLGFLTGPNVPFASFMTLFEQTVSNIADVFSLVSEDFPALTIIMDDIHLSVERSAFSVAVLLDFSKAFDSRVHGLLLRKMMVKFGLSSTACRLFGSFLGQRAHGGCRVLRCGECWNG
jgi:hypothetical protein